MVRHVQQAAWTDAKSRQHIIAKWCHVRYVRIVLYIFMAWLFPNFQCKVSSAGKARAHCVIENGNANVAGVAAPESRLKLEELDSGSASASGSA